MMSRATYNHFSPNPPYTGRIMCRLPIEMTKVSDLESKKLNIGIRQYRGKLYVVDLNDGKVIENVSGDEGIEMEIKNTGTILKIPFTITDLDCDAALFAEEN